MSLQFTQNSSKNPKKRTTDNDLLLLPRFFESVFTTPKYSSAQLDLIIALAKKSLNAGIFKLSDWSYFREKKQSYFRDKIIPRLKELKIKDTSIPVFSSIKYVDGHASIKYKFCPYIVEEAKKMESKGSKVKEGEKKGKGYIIVNPAEFFSLKGLYSKQIYLQLCTRQKVMQYHFYFKGARSIKKLLQLPASFNHRLWSMIIKPSLDEVQNKSLFVFKGATKYTNRITVVFFRYKSAANKRDVGSNLELKNAPQGGPRPHNFDKATTAQTAATHPPEWLRSTTEKIEQLEATLKGKPIEDQDLIKKAYARLGKQQAQRPKNIPQKMADLLKNSPFLKQPPPIS